MLLKEMTDKNVMGPVWIGLYNDLDTWYWSYNHLPLKNMSLIKWAPGNPDNTSGADMCGVVQDVGKWESYPCFYTGPFICYDANNSAANRFIIYYKPPTDWHTGQKYCRKYHTDMASSLTETDNSLMQQLVKSIHYNGAWFGLTKETWKWSDGYEPSYLPWGPNQPDNYYSSENCGGAQNGLLTDEQCNKQNFFVCSAYLVKTQMVKLQVKFDSNVLDPTVQSSILELINLKLQEHGLTMKTTATWKVQPNGRIFYKKIKGN
ncbi:C-type mannose receptor 2-like [Silurus meridionalis]|uniref:C-type mannose receptor 2-like n=1 Tax=Silurus meridionalis TaxID=175797 RepID=UPI001EEAE5B6|nr:C-type mannose receptor 2-like [Silurus meridionalis]